MGLTRESHGRKKGYNTFRNLFSSIFFEVLIKNRVLFLENSKLFTIFATNILFPSNSHKNEIARFLGLC